MKFSHSFILISLLLLFVFESVIELANGRPAEATEDIRKEQSATDSKMESNSTKGTAPGKSSGIDNQDAEDDEDSSVSDENEESDEGMYEYTDVDQLEEKCSKCPASEKYYIVCGTDGVIYKNIGVLWCAQQCKRDLKLKDFGPCEGAKKIIKSTTEKQERSTTLSSSESTSSTAEEEEESASKSSSESMSSTTMVNYHGIKVDPKTQIEVNLDENPEVLQILKLRIKARVEGEGRYIMPEKWRKWCIENKDKCYYGFDPNYNPVGYLFPAEAYSPGDTWFKYHDDVIKEEIARFMNGFTSTIPTRKPKLEWF